MTDTVRQGFPNNDDAVADAIVRGIEERHFQLADYFFLCFNLMFFVVCRLGYLTLIILGLS